MAIRELVAQGVWGFYARLAGFFPIVGAKLLLGHTKGYGEYKLHFLTGCSAAELTAEMSGSFPSRLKLNLLIRVSSVDQYQEDQQNHPSRAPHSLTEMKIWSSTETLVHSVMAVRNLPHSMAFDSWQI